MATDEQIANAEPGKGDSGDVLTEAMRHWRVAEAADGENRIRALEDLKFAMGDPDNGWQWPDAVRSDRQLNRRPCLTFNQIPQFLAQITNDARQNRPAISVRAVEDGDKAKADLYREIIRHIEQASNADYAYQCALESAAQTGEGYWRILSEYGAGKFVQDLRIKPIMNRFAVWYDPMCQEIDGSDAMFAFVCEDVPKEEFKRRWPDAEAQPWETDYPDWYGENSVRVADYYRRVSEKRTLYMWPDGSITREVPEGYSVVQPAQTREYDHMRVEWHKITAGQVLETFEWPGAFIPVVKIYGKRAIIEGRQYTKGLVRDSKDAQRDFNYWTTAATEMVALQQKMPWIGAVGQFEGLEDRWGDANVRNFPYLEYNPIEVNGVVVGPPQRQPMQQIPSGIVDRIRQAQENLYVTTGIYPPALGKKSNETSGVAIRARQSESDNSTFHYVDNMARGIRLTARILLQLIPYYYDTPRQIRVMGDSGRETVQMINDPARPESMLNPDEDWCYDVDVDIGPSYATKRAEARDGMMEFTRAVPQAAAVTGDLIAKAMDWPDADAFAERLRLMLPPQLQEALREGDPMVAQMRQMDREAKEAVQQLTGQLRAKDAEIEALKRDNAVKVAEVQVKEAETKIKGFEAETDRMRVMTERAQAMHPMAMPNTGVMT